MRRKGCKHNIFSNQTLRRWKNYRLTNHYKNWIDLNGCQPAQHFNLDSYGHLPIDKVKLWKMTHLDCQDEKGQIKQIPVVKEVWSQYQNLSDKQPRLTIFPNGDQKMMLRQEHRCPVIEIPPKNQLRALTLPLRTIQSWRDRHERRYQFCIPHRKSKNYKADLHSQFIEIEDGYEDAYYELRDDAIFE
jgi:hypothetical protein